MKIRDHRIIAYTYYADIYCGDCGANLPVVDPEGNEKHPVYSWDRDNFIWNCGECGTLI